MRKLWCLGALAALALTGCQQQPKQELAAANSPLDVRPVQKARPLHMLPPTHDVVPPEDPLPPTIVAAGAPAKAPAPQAPAAHPKPAVASASKPAGGHGSAAVKASYTVRKGDTLYRIAKVKYGDGKQWTRIASANPGVQPQSLKVGQTILIP